MTPPFLTALDLETIELATLDALPPIDLIEDDGWLLAANGGAIGRANSVLPLRSGADPMELKIERALDFYRARDLPPAFRLRLRHKAHAELIGAVEARGFRPEENSLVMVADLRFVATRLKSPAQAQLVETPGPEWQELFLGPGIDPEKGRLRAQTLARGRNAIFAQVEEAGAIAAVGAAAVRDGWVGVHGMRTSAPFRRRGMARRVVSRLFNDAWAKGARRAFLQVEAGNTAAIALYAGLGFEGAWPYAYWR